MSYCQIYKEILDNLEYKNILLHTHEQSWQWDMLNLKNNLVFVLNYLFEFSIEHNLYNKILIEPFMIFLYLETNQDISKLNHLRSLGKGRGELFCILGRYNLDQILKNDSFSQITLD